MTVHTTLGAIAMTAKCSTCRNYVGGSCVITGGLTEPAGWCPTYMPSDRAQRIEAVQTFVLRASTVALVSVALYEFALGFSRFLSAL